MSANEQEAIHTEQVPAENDKTSMDEHNARATSADVDNTKTHAALPDKTDEITALLKAAQSDEQGNFQKIIITQDIFKKIKDSLLVAIQSMEKNPSLLSRAAEFWGELPLWQKILGGVTLTVPTLILGIIANLGFMLAICGVTTVVYAGGGLILDDHHKCDVSVTENLAKGIIGLADLLELTITALDAIRQKLAEEVDKFTAENDRLKENVNQLSSKIETLGIEITAAAKLAVALKTTKEELEKTAHNLKDQVTAQSNLLVANQQELQKVTDAYNANQQLLAEKIKDFSETEQKLQDDLKNARSLADYLGTVSNQLSKTLLSDDQQKEEFTKRLNDFLQNGNASFAALAERWSIAEEKLMKTEEKLTVLKQEYQELNNTHKELLKKQDIQVTRLESIGDKIGFFARNADKAILVRELKTIFDIKIPAEAPLMAEEDQKKVPRQA
ncbi:LegC2/C7 family Dot/Icm T4SS effector [Legionella drancourtii]|uniref:Inclusion membrane protein A n=1 Tax=Legionella drancourtii LLAP12 TaxID=658187 RepID=G9ELA5_9GAMM|nr:LegC2/C7 family Dot/Icm T4SS effector [Legionella drancourtii]EHL31994.1 hypothetical protein LDG_6166 [Legionella drancourtii LLAP12]